MKAFPGRILLALAALGALTAAAAPAKKSGGGGPYLPAETAVARCGFYPARNSGGTLFVSGKSNLRLIPDKPFCIIDNVKVYQCFPTRRSSGRSFLSRLDVQKTVAPLSPSRGGVFRHRVVTITIDPGHGGRDRGAAGRLLLEKMATLMLANQVARILRNCRYRVYLTRSRDRYLSLPDRCRLQKQHRSDLFISIHVNSAVKGHLHGIETFALTPAGAASTSGGPPSNTSYSGNRFDGNNLLLAYLIQQALLRRTGACDRGVKRARWAVLKEISAPGVLVEVGFLSNRQEERLLLDPKYRDRIARGIAEGIVAYHRIMRQGR